jgi:subtilisin family serine protease
MANIKKISIKPGKVFQGIYKFDDPAIFIPIKTKKPTDTFIRLSGLDRDLDLYLSLPTDEGPLTDKWMPFQSSTNAGDKEEVVFSKLPRGEYRVFVVNKSSSDTNSPVSFKLEVNGEVFGKITRFPDDPYLNDQWYLFNAPDPRQDLRFSRPNVDITAPEAWKIRHKANNIVVAVIDEGIDIGHPDLKENIWFNPLEIAGDGIDNDGNGYIDDINGWDFVKNTGIIAAGDHGTHVAGTIAARGNNGIGISGIAWNAKLMSLDVFSDNRSTSPILYGKAIRYAVDNGAKVINLSLGGNKKQDPETFLSLIGKNKRGQDKGNAKLLKTLQYAYDKDVFISIAAGNDGRQDTEIEKWKNVGDLDQYVTDPAIFSRIFGNIASVASTESTNRLSDFSSYGKSVSIAAPGGEVSKIIVKEVDNRGNAVSAEATDRYGILSTVPRGTGDLRFEGDYKFQNGTSMAAPVVSGIATLIRAENASITAPETLAIIRAGATKSKNLEGKVSGALIANLYGSMQLASNWKGPKTLTSIGQDEGPVVNLSFLTEAQTITGEIKLKDTLKSPESGVVDVITGFYRVLDAKGSVMNALGELVKPGQKGYKSIALNKTNIVDEISGITTGDTGRASKDYELSEVTHLAPFIQVDKKRYFPFSESNKARNIHFTVLGPNRFGFDRIGSNNGDEDAAFKDLIIKFNSDTIL